MKKWFSAFCFIFSFVLGHAQIPKSSKDISEDDLNWVRVEGLVDLPNNTTGIFLYLNFDSDSTVLYSEDKQQKLTFLGKIAFGECLYNPNKTLGAGYKNGEIVLCSEMPFRATQVCCNYAFKGKSAQFVSSEIFDPSADLLAEGDSLLKMGDIEAAVAAYGGIMYPMSYMDETEKAKQILDVAAAKASKEYVVKNYAKAASYMQTAMEFFGAYPFKEGTYNTADELKSERDFDAISAILKTHSTDYALYLYRAGRLDESITWNAYLAKVLPDYANPCLAWADALYDQGKADESKSVYLQYKLRMERAGKHKLIPARVFKRL